MSKNFFFASGSLLIFQRPKQRWSLFLTLQWAEESYCLAMIFSDLIRNTPRCDSLVSSVEIHLISDSSVTSPEIHFNSDSSVTSTEIHFNSDSSLTSVEIHFTSDSQYSQQRYASLWHFFELIRDILYITQTWSNQVRYILCPWLFSELSKSSVYARLFSELIRNTPTLRQNS